jgi:phosphate/sulfate permease
MFGLDLGMTTILLVCLCAACIFEFINGFHDTANAVATVIYTNSLKPKTAVFISGFFNFLGVYLGGIGVAMGIIHLLPMSILVDQCVAHNVAMIMAIILSAIIWNLGTWYFGIPCSSSHTLLGSLFGVGIVFSMMSGMDSAGLNWAKVKDAGLSLMLSPFIGFGLTMGLVLLLKKYAKKLKMKKLFDEPSKKKAPPFYIRTLQIFACTCVSYTHGSNDGQKGVGLVMIILIALAPARFSLNHTQKPENLIKATQNVEMLLKDNVDSTNLSGVDKAQLAEINIKLDSIELTLQGKKSFLELKKTDNFQLRKDILLVAKQLEKVVDSGDESNKINFKSEAKAPLTAEIKNMKSYTEYSPWWVIFMISLSLGLGTMIGWKRIVVTIGEKIGKENLNYAQGASAQIVTASTILMSTQMKLPVSTTHILSSGIAGSMVATNGLKNLRMKTVKNILIAWLVTLPVTVVLSGILYWILISIIK